MPERKRRYPLEEFGRRGEEIYDRVVRPTLTPEDDGKFVAIDIESEAYEIDRDDMTACLRLQGRYPDAQTFVLRVGHPAAYRLGGRFLFGLPKDEAETTAPVGEHPPVRRRRYPLEEFARRGREIYARVVFPVADSADHGKYVAIDIESEAYEIDQDERAAAERVFRRYPDAQIWMERLGFPAADRIGGRSFVGGGE